jgi:hypothetical protein
MGTREEVPAALLVAKAEALDAVATGQDSGGH